MKYVPQDFNSTRRINPGAYAKAAQNLTQSVNQIYKTNRETAPDFGKMAQRQQNINAALTKSAIAAESKITEAGIKVKGKLQEKKEILEGEQALAKGRRAGKLMLFGGGAIMQGIKMAARKPIEKPEPIYHVETPFKFPDSPVKDQLDKFKNNGIGEAPVMPGQSNLNPGTMDTPPAIPTYDQPPAEVRTMPTGGTVSQSQMQSLLIKNGMSPENARIGAAVGMAESRGRSGIDTVQSGLDPNKTNEYSIGLWQINTQAHQDKLNARGWTADDLRDPNKNAQIAVEVFNEAGGFTPWSAHNNRSHEQFL